MLNVSSIATNFTSGTVTGTMPNVSIGSATITTTLNGGWYSITPDRQPTAGSYDVTLSIKNSTNSVMEAEKYAVIKRDMIQVHGFLKVITPWQLLILEL